ncbi:hypothetical protein [Aquimarina algicola]|uniref:Uncharacterized protein n=1 Tax=Aquimarina algicola TaxID=2589995 RepID=A0A504J0J2_9FLAO|nr:hypothetical protein [Aquimarina algicola]TPN81213.1 hypothetical protein FHK87_24835 [Aquimarina algicola]
MKVTKLLSTLQVSLLLIGTILFFTNCERDEEIIPENTIKSVSIPNISGYYTGSDKGHYYIKQIDNNIFWMGEDPTGIWVNIFRGTLVGNKISGIFYDVPKGRNRGFRELEFVVNGNVINKTYGPGFGGNVLTKSVKPNDLPGERPQGFGTKDNINDLTGKWKANDRGTYYIRQIGDRVVWFGEQDYTSGRPVWSNVAFGTRVEDTITLEWADVPKGRNGGSGQLTLTVDDANQLSRIRVSGGFGGSRWKR